MPPLDLDAMVRGGDVVVCDNALFHISGGAEEEEEEESERDDDPYAPAESLRLRIGEDIDWSDIITGAGAVAAVLQRGDSTKGAGANPKSAARRSSAHHHATAPRKVVPVVIGGLPPAAAGGKVRCSPCRIGGRARVFAAGEQQAAVVGSPHQHHDLEEPGSPKVSCLGAVRPKQRPVATDGRGWWRSWFPARVTCCFSSRA